MPFMSKLTAETVTDGPRLKILGLIARRPGLSFTQLRSLIERPYGLGALQHHLAVLEATGHVRSIRRGRWRRYYAASLVTADIAQADAITRNPEPGYVYEVVCQRPGLNQTQLSRRILGMTRQNVLHHLRRLEKDGALRSDRHNRHERDGRGIHYWPIDQEAT